jgi:formimidoylglutamate deiminase
LGTDSNAQIDLLEDARCLEYHLRMEKLSRAVLPTDALYRAVTNTGAHALGLAPDAGDYFTVDLSHPSIAGWEGSDVSTQLIFATQLPAIQDVFVSGKQVIADGRHPDQDEIVTAFQRLQKRIWQ